MSNYFCVYDFETDGINPKECGITELGAIMIDPYNLEVVESSSFFSGVKPEGFDSPTYYNDHKSTIDWHCKNKQMKVDEFMNMLSNYPTIDVVWPTFVNYVNTYNKTGNQYDAPHATGMNIRRFDAIITERLNEKFAVKKLFHYEDVDLRDLAFVWLKWYSPLKSRSMDSLRKHFGLTMDNAHSALQDVKQEGEVISRFLKFHKAIAAKQNYFKGAFAQ